jgi:HTH-type transcriptional regulator/antitoxin HigA
MSDQPIRTATEYREALKEIEALMCARTDTPEGLRLAVLVKMVEVYECKFCHL